MSDVKLKPCPFCGSPAELEHDSDHHGEWFNLGCSRHWHKPGIDPDNACIAGRLFYTADPEDEASAIEKWNTRAARPRPHSYRRRDMSERRAAIDALDAIADFLAEDVLAMSDEEIRAELIADGLDPEVEAEKSRQLFERVLAEHDRRRALQGDQQ